MKILVTGANGFIGSVIVESLLRNGHDVLACCRSRRNLPASNRVQFVPIDFSMKAGSTDWPALLEDVDAVVNCAGILREARRGDFERIHVEVPAALVGACIDAGTARFVQISALGDPADGTFIASKHRFDRQLLESGLAATVLRPSVVLSTRGSYGGTSLLRALAASPLVVFLPGNGEQKLQPVLAEDLAEIVLRCLTTDAAKGKVLQVVGEDVLSLKQTLGLLRKWMDFSPPHWIRVPRLLVRLVAWIGDRINVGPIGQTMGSMLERGNFGVQGAHAATTEASGYAARSLRSELEIAPSFVEDRWHARLHALRPLLWLILVMIWLGSGIAGLLANSNDYAATLDALRIPATLQGSLVLFSSLLDLALGCLLLLRWRTRLVLGLMLVSVLAYTLLLGTMAGALWLDPLGGLIKNFAIAGLLMVMLAIDDAR
ncbi:complex I NDUFA9 subunit family protein [Dokdonella sp.]|uniref:complex I NDUFA9 subunit family protein n=1 Tax=Dokdonella sp. TaxID=2291710 RepID=UPI003529CE43